MVGKCTCVTVCVVDKSSAEECTECTMDTPSMPCNFDKEMASMFRCAANTYSGDRSGGHNPPEKGHEIIPLEFCPTDCGEAIVNAPVLDL